MQVFKLKNGLTVLYDKKKSNSVCLNALVKVGSNNESSNEKGVSHFLEHILFEGTKHFTTRALANEIEKVGGEINAATSNERTFYYTLVPKNHVEKAFKVISDILINPLFNAKAIEKEREVIVSEIKMLHDEPRHLQWILLQQNLFEKNKAKYPVYGSIKSVQSLTRQKIINYYRKHYLANNTTLSVVGEVPNVKALVSKYFSSFRSSKLEPYKFVEESLQKSVKKIVVDKKTEHSYLLIGYKASPFTKKDAYTFEVIEGILGRGQSSRLFDEIRIKRGLAYSVGAVYEANLDFGFFAIHLNTDAKNLEECKKIVLDQFKLKNLTQKELQEAKDYVEGNFLIKNEDNKEKADNNAFFSMVGKSSPEYIKNIRKVTLNDVKKAVKAYFNGNYTQILIKQKL
ncbi:MAG TPA: pitrilysin family protein [Candidatus Nanoarchaeia archaeon]|nr:pitrilysin family protein [Candidatus Nanoarchaeia archaeon]